MNSCFNASDLISSCVRGNKIILDEWDARQSVGVYRDRKAWVFPRVLVPSLGKCFEPRLSSGITLAGCVRPTCTFVHVRSYVLLSAFLSRSSKVDGYKTRRRNETAGIYRRWWISRHGARRGGVEFFFHLYRCLPSCVYAGKKGEKLYLSPLSTSARVALMDTGFGIALLRSRNAWQCRFLAIACIIAFSNRMYNCAASN